MTMGYDAEFFMQAAGVIEFTLAFALIWTPLVRRVSAIMLAAAFIAAIAQFGKIDAIGHALIIVVLLAISADNVRVPEQRIELAAGAGCLWRRARRFHGDLLRLARSDFWLVARLGSLTSVSTSRAVHLT